MSTTHLPEREGERRPPFPLWVCYAVIAVGVGLLLWFEFGKPVLAEDELLSELMTMTLTRCIGAAVFLVILIYRGFRVLNPFRKGTLRALLFSLPAWAVVINNAPILSTLRGDAYLVHAEPTYIAWFAAECLAIGLFEELAFRGVILLSLAEDRRKTRLDLFVCIILSSAVFGAVHLANLLAGAGADAVLRQIGYSFLIGAMCSVVLYRTRNIWLCVLLHAVYDFSGSLMPTLGAGRWWDTPTVVFTVILALAVTAFYVVALWRTPPESLECIYQKRGDSL